ncbi:unnamed protein product [Mycena citricolor]|uniref:Uncharacterized protein n=1 Tax=Mycena citricolor TaxID=2018698 RepID=A0AAD2Q3Q9_9AGAR|nr:unnamed protein product [Mycena citricolor]
MLAVINKDAWSKSAVNLAEYGIRDYGSGPLLHTRFCKVLPYNFMGGIYSAVAQILLAGTRVPYDREQTSLGDQGLHHPKFIDQGMRMEVSMLGREFTDFVKMGKNLEGQLYFNAFDSLEQRDEVSYYIERYIAPLERSAHVWIRFFTEDIDQCHAEFFGPDPDNTAESTGMDRITRSGTWDRLDVGSVPGEVRKLADVHSLRFTLRTLNVRAIIPVPDDNPLAHQSVNYAGGTFYFTDLKAVFSGAYAAYDDRRIVFYKDRSSSHIVGYFIPYEMPGNDLASLRTLHFQQISWENIQ